jgi:hypothetical protein
MPEAKQSSSPHSKLDHHPSSEDGIEELKGVTNRLRSTSQLPVDQLVRSQQLVDSIREKDAQHDRDEDTKERVAMVRTIRINQAMFIFIAVAVIVAASWLTYLKSEPKWVVYFGMAVCGFLLGADGVSRLFELWTGKKSDA